jgi:hypothetical protein
VVRKSSSIPIIAATQSRKVGFMGVVENMKEVADLIKKIGDIELNRKIVNLEGELIDADEVRSRMAERKRTRRSE